MGRPDIGIQYCIRALKNWNVVEEFQEAWEGQAVEVCSDNVGAVFIIDKGCDEIFAFNFVVPAR
jgi:hypothetical protein